MNYLAELFNTKQFKNSLSQFRDMVEKRGFEISIKWEWDNIVLEFTRDKAKSKKYYEDRDKKIEAFRERRAKYFANKEPKKKIRLVKRKKV